MTEYINEKWLNSKPEIAHVYMNNSEDVTAYNIQWNKLWIEDKSKQTQAWNIYNEMFVLVGDGNDNRIMSVGVRINSNTTSIKLNEVSLIRHEKFVKLMRNFVWNDNLFILICYDKNVCVIYTNNGDQLQHRQNIEHKGDAIDAQFFIQTDQLYLVIANNFRDFLVPSVIYLWTGTYMDKIKEITLSCVVSIATFDSHRGSTIIIFGLNDNAQMNMGSVIYKLTTLDKKIERIQYLPTQKPVKLHHYIYHDCDFLLVIDENSPARVLWWEGKEFLPWHEVNDIHGSDIILNNVNINNETFIIVAQKNILTLYKVTSTTYDKLNVTKHKEASRIVDFRVWPLDSNGIPIITLVLITQRGKDLYRVEPWQLMINSTKINHTKTDDVKNIKMEKLKVGAQELESRLKMKMPYIEKRHEAWKVLQPADKDNMKIPKLSISTLNWDLNSSTKISNIIQKNQTISPHNLKILVKNLAAKVKTLLAISRMLPRRKNNKTLIVPHLVITGNAQIETLVTSSLETKSINGIKINNKINNRFSLTNNQTFDEPLKARYVTIHELKVDSLCGIPQKYWLFKNETSKMPLKPIDQKVNQSLVQIADGTVTIKSNISFARLKSQTLDMVDLKKFFDELFIIGSRQIIQGNLIYKNLVSIHDLQITEKLNENSINDLVTLTTDQHFSRSIKIDSLEIVDLWVNKINGVSVEDSARINEDNIIHDQVILDNLIVTEKLIINDPRSFVGGQRQIQIYEDVRIRDNVVINNLQLTKQTAVILGKQKTKGYELDNLFYNSWTKSSDQIISSPIVVFDKGLIIDELNSKCFNGYKKEDYLYTNVVSLSAEFGNINFSNLIINGSRNNNKLFDTTKNYLIINRPVYFQFLAVRSLYTKHYNGMPINVIMNNDIKQPRVLHLPHGMHFCTLVVNVKLIVENLFYKMPNQGMSDILFIDEDHYYSRNLIINNLHNRISIKSNDSALDVTIHGELIIDELTIEQTINNEPVKIYLNRLSKQDIHINNDKTNQQIIINNLTVLYNSSIGYLEGHQFDDLMANILYKTKDQEIDTMTFNRIKTNNIQVTLINDISFNEVKFINEPMIIDNNVIFTNLSADIQTINLNGIDINNYLNKKLIAIATGKINSLRVNGSILWIGNKTGKLGELFKNAVTLADEQTIEATTDFTSEVFGKFVTSVNRFKPDIEEIVKDIVTANNNSVVIINGKKVLQGSLTIGELSVNGNLNVNQLETMTIQQLNESLVRRTDELININSCTFMGGLKIYHLIVPNLGIGMPNLTDLFVLSDVDNNILPAGTRFEKLIVRGNATVMSLDGVNLDGFLAERVTLHGNHEIYGDIKFNGSVSVKDKAIVSSSINGVSPDDLFINDTSLQQIVDGNTIFIGALEIDDLMVNYINGIKVDEYVIVKKSTEDSENDNTGLI